MNLFVKELTLKYYCWFAKQILVDNQNTAAALESALTFQINFKGSNYYP